MSEQESILEMQRLLVAKEKAKQLHQQNKFRKDIRSQIARANGYNPEEDALKTDWEPQPYPTWVKLPNGKSVIANTKEEHDALLGIKAEPAKSVNVDIAQLQQPEAVRVKRKYTRKAQATELPQNLD